MVGGLVVGEVDYVVVGEGLLAEEDAAVDAVVVPAVLVRPQAGDRLRLVEAGELVLDVAVALTLETNESIEMLTRFQIARSLFQNQFLSGENL